MKKRNLFLGILGFLILSIALPSYSWQGRMEGMGNPYGLVQDESDFLIHPAEIAKGEGVQFYGDYRFTYTRVTDWNYNVTLLNTSGAFGGYHEFDNEGKEYGHDAMLGAAFPLGPGRMGAFFAYQNRRADYDGDRIRFPIKYDMDSDLRDFSFRLIYAFPINTLRPGSELGVAYRDEAKKWWIPDFKGYLWIPSTRNNVRPFRYSYDQNLHFFMNPYDSKYWEIFWKAGLGGKFTAASFDWTIRGGNIISSENEYEYSYGLGDENVDMDGNVRGYNIGSDLWVRYQMNDSLTLPFVVSVDYARIRRNGHGIGTGSYDLNDSYSYEHREIKFEAKVGGGVEKKISTGSLIGAALYYNYLEGREDQWFDNPDWPYHFAYGGFPLHKEHRVEMKFAGEKQLSTATSLCLGLGFFYGWVVAHDFKQSEVMPYYGMFYNATGDISLNGHTWGVNASLGGTLKFSLLTFEPFINGGYRSLKLGGDGQTISYINDTKTRDVGDDMDQNRREWFVGGGFSIKF